MGTRGVSAALGKRNKKMIEISLYVRTEGRAALPRRAQKTERRKNGLLTQTETPNGIQSCGPGAIFFRTPSARAVPFTCE